MKKVLLIMALFSVLLLFGCSDKGENIVSEKSITNTDTVDDNELQEMTNIEFNYIVLDENTIQVYGYTGENIPDTVEIPDEIEGMKVVSIEGIFKSENRIKKVIIPETVTEIGRESFSLATSIQEIEIKGTIQKIGYRAFYGCENLKKLSFPEGLIEIEDMSIALCGSLEELHLPASLSGDFSSSLMLDTLSDELRIYTPAESDVEEYAKRCGITVLNE